MSVNKSIYRMLKPRSIKLEDDKPQPPPQPIKQVLLNTPLIPHKNTSTKMPSLEREFKKLGIQPKKKQEVNATPIGQMPLNAREKIIRGMGLKVL